MILNRYERMVARRYLLPGKGEGFIFVVAGISLGAVMLGVMALIVVMSVMNGFRAELFDKVTGLNGHAVVAGMGGRMENWRPVLERVRRTPDIVSAQPLIEVPLMASRNGRVEGILLRGMPREEILSNPSFTRNVIAGSLAELRPGSTNVAIGSHLAEKLGLSVGSPITILSPEGRTTPFGTVPRIVEYNVAAIFEVGLYDFDKAFVVMPMEDAQELLMLGDAIGMIEVTTTDPDRVGEILAPLQSVLARRAIVNDWRTMNAALFEAIQVERVVMFCILSLIILVAAFNILSSLTMLVRAKTRDIAILRTMGATRRAMLRIFMTVGLTIGTLGTMLGVGFGFLILHFRQPIVDFIQALSGQNLWDPSVRFITELPARTNWFEVALIVLLAIGSSFLFTLYPAWKAASTDPVQVLRYE
jgi:lipoprotein-releasing system permease protein